MPSTVTTVSAFAGAPVGGGVGMGKNVLEPLFPPIWIPDEPTDTTIGWLLESVSVATEPGFAVEPFGRITPVEPGMALIVLLPTTAITLAAVVVAFGRSGRVGSVDAVVCVVDF